MQHEMLYTADRIGRPVCCFFTNYFERVMDRLDLLPHRDVINGKHYSHLLETTNFVGPCQERCIQTVHW